MSVNVLFWLHKKSLPTSANDKCFCAPAIRFGRMPQAEKLKLKAESKMVDKEVKSPMLADHKILIRQIHEAYMKNFNMNKAKARLILTGKTSKMVKDVMKPRTNVDLFCYMSVLSTTPNPSSVFLSSLSSFTTWRRSSWLRRLYWPTWKTGTVRIQRAAIRLRKWFTLGGMRSYSRGRPRPDSSTAARVRRWRRSPS